MEKGSGDFFQQLWTFVTRLGQTSWITLLVGLVSLAIVRVLRRFAPVVPAPLAAVVFGNVVVHLFGLQDHGVKIVGRISGGLPSFGLPARCRPRTTSGSLPARDHARLGAGIMALT